MFDVTCVGLLVADIVGKPVEALPERGRLALVDRIELHVGGCAANTGVDLAKLGVSTAIVGKVGNDGFGDFMVNELAGAGIDTRGVSRDGQAATSATMVMSHGDGERSFLHYFGANGTLSLDDIDWSIALDAKVLHVAGSLLLPGLDGEPTAELLRRAQESGMTTALDTAWDATGAWLEKVGPSLAHVDYFVPSIEEARMLAGGLRSPEDIARFLIDRGVRVVGLKMGGEGCYIASRDGFSLTLPALRVPVVDALGAGDAFAAGFLCGIVHQWDLERCARFATAVGALCVGAVGATTGIRGFEATEQFLMQHAEG